MDPVPDLHLNNYLNADALLGRLAQAFADVGNDALLKGLLVKENLYQGNPTSYRVWSSKRRCIEVLLHYSGVQSR